MISYNVQIIPEDPKDGESLISMLQEYTSIVNEVSHLQFERGFDSIVGLHNAFYYPARERHPDMPSQTVIKAQQECMASYKSIKSNNKKASKPFEKKRLSIRIDKRMFSLVSDDLASIRLTTREGRKPFRMLVYPKLMELLERYRFADPLIYVKEGKIMISLPFEVKPSKSDPEKLVLGVDLGIRRVATCSDGRILIDKIFNERKRRLRHLKSNLQSSGTKTARKHLKKLRRKERNINRNQTHLVANEILRTEAGIIALENLKGIKAKKSKYQNKNAISQVPIYELRRVLTYKAENAGKRVRLVSPLYTSQIDSQTGKREGERKGCRFYAVSGKVYDADVNAAINIALRVKHPVLQGNLLHGQGEVKRPSACKSNGCQSNQSSCKPTNLFVGI